MKDSQGKRNTFAFRLSREKIRVFRGSSAEEKLDWLEEANKFVAEFVPEEKLKRWRKLINKNDERE